MFLVSLLTNKHNNSRASSTVTKRLKMHAYGDPGQCLENLRD